MKLHHPFEHVHSTKYDQKRPPNLYIQQPTVYLLCVEEGLYLCKSKHRLFGWRNHTMPAQLWDRDSSMIRASVDILSLLLSCSSSSGAQPRHPCRSWRHGDSSSSWLSRTTHALCSSIASAKFNHRNIPQILWWHSTTKTTCNHAWQFFFFRKQCRS